MWKVSIDASIIDDVMYIILCFNGATSYYQIAIQHIIVRSGNLSGSGHLSIVSPFAFRVVRGN